MRILNEFQMSLNKYKYTVVLNSFISNKKRAYNQERYNGYIQQVLAEIKPIQLTTKYAIENIGKGSFKEYIQYDVTPNDYERLENALESVKYDQDELRSYLDAYKIINLAAHSEGVNVIMSNINYYAKFKFLGRIPTLKSIDVIKEMGYKPNGWYTVK